MNTNLPCDESAQLCAGDNCITVYGDTARAVNAIVLTATALIAIALIAKWLD
ncbi:MAG TPA: hypothetical protein VMT76_06985 [Puia sp.]|nr:hypothetical protein [Puia sp.]